eukprot:1332358-Amorphochlora_amoeboformis.AAC.1
MLLVLLYELRRACQRQPTGRSSSSGGSGVWGEGNCKSVIVLLKLWRPPSGELSAEVEQRRREDRSTRRGIGSLEDSREGLGLHVIHMRERWDINTRPQAGISRFSRAMNTPSVQGESHCEWRLRDSNSTFAELVSDPISGRKIRTEAGFTPSIL